MKSDAIVVDMPNALARPHGSLWRSNLDALQWGVNILLSVAIPCWGWLGGIVMMGRGEMWRGNLMVVSGVTGLFFYLWLLQSM